VNRLHRAYETLGISDGASLRELRASYRALVRKWHPDNFGKEPVRQHQAMEMLKDINEAYELILGDINSRSKITSLEQVREWVPSAASEWVSPSTEYSTSSEGFKASKEVEAHNLSAYFLTGVFTFLKSWQNVLFAALVLTVVYKSFATFGGLGSALEMLALPTVLAIICNTSRLGSKRSTWAAYVTVVCMSGAVMLIDSILYKNEINEALVDENSQPSGASAEVRVYGGYVPQGAPGRLFSDRNIKGTEGPTLPKPPNVMPPAAPLAPEMPAAPSAPIAPPAR